MPPSRTSGDTSTQEGKKRSKYTRQACQQCRRRRTKCDQGSPTCSTCVRYGDDCSYAEGGDSRTTYTKQHIAALEERVKMLEMQLNDRPAGEPCSRKETAAPLEGEISLGVGATELRRPSGASRLRRDVESQGYLLYGPTSAFQHLPEPTLPVPPSSHTFISPGFPPNASGSGSTGAADYNDSRSEWRQNLPHRAMPRGGWDDALHELVLDSFFAVYNNWYCIVNEAAFRQDMKTCLSAAPSPSLVRTSAYSPLLHNAILALGCWNCDDPRAHDLAVVDWFIARARATFDEEGEHPTLSTLQGLLVLGHCFTCANKPNLGYLYAGIAIRACSTLGLEVDCSSHVRRGNMTELMRRERVRTYWACFLVDKRWSAYMGRAPTLPLSAAEIGFPEISDAEDLDVWTPHSKAFTTTYSGLPPLLKPCASLRSTTFHWTARLSTLEDRILTSIYDPKVEITSDKTALEVSAIHLALEEWLAALPVPLRIAPQVTTPPPSHIIILNTMYQFLMILLHRPWYLRHETGQNTWLNDASYRRCNVAASKIVSLLELYKRSPGLRFTTFALVQAIFSAATTTLLAMAHAEQQSQAKRAANARRLFTACLDSLKPSDNPCLVTQFCHRVLSRLHDDCGFRSETSARSHEDGPRLTTDQEQITALAPDAFPGSVVAPVQGSVSASQGLASHLPLTSNVHSSAASPSADTFFPDPELDPFAVNQWLAPSSFGPPLSADVTDGSLMAYSDNSAVPSFPHGWLADIENLLGSKWINQPIVPFDLSLLWETEGSG